MLSPWQGAEKCPPQGRPDRNAGNSSACARFRILPGAITPATAHRCPHACRGPKAPGQRPPRPGGRWPAVGADCTGPGGSVAQGRGKRSAFPPPTGPIPFPGLERFSWQAVGLLFQHPADALRQSNRENVPQERFQSVLRARNFQPRRVFKSDSRPLSSACTRSRRYLRDTRIRCDVSTNHHQDTRSGMPF